jgi:hypothetical protein
LKIYCKSIFFSTGAFGVDCLNQIDDSISPSTSAHASVIPLSSSETTTLPFILDIFDYRDKKSTLFPNFHYYCYGNDKGNDPMRVRFPNIVIIESTGSEG